MNGAMGDDRPTAHIVEEMGKIINAGVLDGRDVPRQQQGGVTQEKTNDSPISPTTTKNTNNVTICLFGEVCETPLQIMVHVLIFDAQLVVSMCC